MAEEGVKNVIFRIRRYDPESGAPPHFQEFTVPTKRGMTVLDGLLYIKENLDATLAFRSSCRMSICGSCAVLINEYPHLACHTQIEEFKTDLLTLKPLPNHPTIKDLVPDLSLMFEKHRRIKPYLIRRDTQEVQNPTAEYAQSAEELNAYLQFSYCIKCGICVAACPTSASDKAYLGPQAMGQCYRYLADSRDEGAAERLPLVGGDHGAWYCHLANACAESCPKGVDPALAIQLLKRRLTWRSLGLAKDKTGARVVPPPTESKPKMEVPKFNVPPRKEE